jgi:hypothetical protein
MYIRAPYITYTWRIYHAQIVQYINLLFTMFVHVFSMVNYHANSIVWTWETLNIMRYWFYLYFGIRRKWPYWWVGHFGILTKWCALSCWPWDRTSIMLILNPSPLSALLVWWVIVPTILWMMILYACPMVSSRYLDMFDQSGTGYSDQYVYWWNRKYCFLDVSILHAVFYGVCTNRYIVIRDILILTVIMIYCR